MPKVELDKFYTKNNVVDICIALVKDLDKYDVIIEPSAGSGAFSNKLKNCIAYDLEPENKKIIKQDFLQLNAITGKNKLFIGNPPFGQRSVLAKKFIKHCQFLGAETIAFILPDTFSKITNQNYKLFPIEWSLVVEQKLPDNSFMVGKQEYHVPCSFYIWTKKKSNINLRKTKLPKPEKIEFLPREARDADFVLNGNSGKIKELQEVTNPKSEHYIKVKNKQEKETIKNLLAHLKYSFKSSVNGGNAWISQYEIVEAYFNSGYEKPRKQYSQNTLFSI